MDGSRWDKVQSLFHVAAELPQEQRLAFLDRECTSDPTLLDDVLALLEEDGAPSQLLDQPLSKVARGTLDDAAALADAHRQIGPYRIERVLGEGGMGTVFLARRGDLDSLAAIKILRDAWISPERRRRFAEEQRTLAHLNHPGIARLLDADTLPDGTPYFVMEYVDGLPLDVYCDRNRSGLLQRLRLFRAVCSAVQFAHQHAVIHRDLKPSNILVAADGTAKLLDFGIAKHIAELDPSADQTRTGLRLLTPAYASPEQIRGESAGIQSDVYSLGVILYQLLSGKPPFDLSSRSPLEAISILSTSEPVRPSLVARRVRQQAGSTSAVDSAVSWDDLDVLCLTAIHRDPAKRYSSTEAFIRDIDHYVNGEPLEARPDTFGYRVGKFIRRNRTAVAAVAFTFLAVGALVAYFTFRLADERNAALAEAARVQRIQQFMLRLFQGGDEAAGPARDLSVATLIDRGVQEARVLDRDPVVQSELYQTLGDIHQKLGNLDQADSLLSSALERRRRQPGSAESESLVALGLLRIDQAKLYDAERLIREGLDKAIRSLPPEHPAVLSANEALARVLEEKGNYPEAIQVLDETVQLRTANGFSQAGLAGTLYQLANVHFYAGNYQESDSLNRRVLPMYRQIYGERHPAVAEVLVNLGAVQQDLGHYTEAEKYHREALDINREFYGENHYRTASSMTMVARALVFQKRYDEAVALLTRALAIQERVFGPVHPRVASALNELGSVAVHRDSYPDAEAAYSRMAAIYRQIYSGKHYLIGIAVSNLGSARMAQRDFAGAERLFREALEMFGLTLAPDHLNIGIARVKLGRSLLRQKRFVEAEQETLAGYLMLKKQANPSVGYLQSARADLAEAYAAMSREDKAQQFRDELAQAQTRTAK